jgi:hypothetical protein
MVICSGLIDGSKTTQAPPRSGGMSDMAQAILKEGAKIVDGLSSYKHPVISMAVAVFRDESGNQTVPARETRFSVEFSLAGSAGSTRSMPVSSITAVSSRPWVDGPRPSSPVEDESAVSPLPSSPPRPEASSELTLLTRPTRTRPRTESLLRVP